jgi:predicted nucleic acid-binding protein
MKTPEYLIYMDVCCFNRPFDDLRQERIRLEAEAIMLILERCQSDKWTLIGSEVLDAEIKKTPDRDKMEAVVASMTIIKNKIAIDETITQRAKELIKLNFKLYDAFHIACAEACKAEVMLTTDDRLLRRALRLDNVLQVAVENPVTWLMKATQEEEDNEDDTNGN